MSTDWSQGGQNSGTIQHGNGPYPPAAPEQNHSSAPTCYNCGLHGHFMVACPEPTRAVPAGLAAARAAEANQAPQNASRTGDSGHSQRSPWIKGQKVGAIVTRYPLPKNAPVITRYAVPTHHPQYRDTQGSYEAPAPPYQQYPGPGPTVQTYPQQIPPPQTSHPSYPQNQHYGASEPLYSYSQPPPPPTYGPPAAPPQHYGYSGYQNPSYNQYPQYNTPQPYDGQGYHHPQQRGSPLAPAPYQPPSSSYFPQNGGYDETHSYGVPPTPYSGPNPTYWKPPPTISASYDAPTYRQSHLPQYDSGYHSEYVVSSGNQSQPPLPPQQEYGYADDGYPRMPSTPNNNYDQNEPAPAPTSQSSLTNQQNFPPNVSNSINSSRASTPYARRGSSSSSTRKGARRASNTPSGGERASANESSQTKTSEKSDEENRFNWEFKKIFKEDPQPQSVSLAQPLSTTFDMTPVPLLDPRPSNSVSRYARRENLKEFKQSIRKSPQWSYLQEDPAFSDAKLEGPLVPCQNIPSRRERRPENLAARTSQPANLQISESSQKRAWSEEKDDTGNQVNQDGSTELRNEILPNKRQKNIETQIREPSSGIVSERQTTPTATATTPILGQAGTPSLGAIDDVWAPQPGEGISSTPVIDDPTEALLASLGVSGSPKPVASQFPPVLIPAQDHYNPPYGTPPRQDSGYFSSRGSYSSGHNNFSKRRNSQWETQAPPPQHLRRLDGGGDTPSPADNSPRDMVDRQNGNSWTQGSSPVTPTSADILGKLVQQPRKNSSGKKSDPVRQSDEAVRKFKRPQPVVAEAYSRRW